MNTESQQPLVTETDTDIVEAELTRLLGERRFAGAPQMSAFLKYIVRQTITGKADRIKAYSVGVDALGKPDTFDAQTDPSVRVLALRLRKTLKTVYSSATDNLAIIELKVGTYVPQFYKPTMAYGSDLLLSDIGIDVQADAGSAKLTGLSGAGARPDKVFVVKENKALKPVSDHDTAELQATDIGLPSNVSQHTSKGNTLKRENHTVTSHMSTQWSTLNKWWIVAGATLLAAAWQLSLTQSNTDGFSVESLQILPATTSSMDSQHVSGSSESQYALAVARPTVPTVYIEFSEGQRNLDRQLMLMLSSSFVQAGTVRVVRRDDSPVSQDREFWPGEYQLVVNGFIVEDEMRVDTQLVSLSSGELLYADTVTVDGFEESFSTQNLLSIETMASRIVSLEGPLYRDYCLKSETVQQSGCPAS